MNEDTSFRYSPDLLVDAAGGELRTVARRLSIDPALLCRPLTDRQADRYACKLGLHPGTVWGADWWRPGKGRSTLATTMQQYATDETNRRREA